MKKISRRNFLKSAVATSSISGLQFAQAGNLPGDPSSFSPTVVNLFMRGGMDGLNVVPPLTSVNRSNYESLRPDIAVPATGTNSVIDIGSDFGFHPAAAGLANLYINGDLAIVQGTGLPQVNTTRSHFDASALRELGTPTNLNTQDGWMTRHMATHPLVTGGEIIPVLVSGSSAPDSLRGFYNALTIDQVSGYHPNSGTFADTHVDAIAGMYTGSSPLDAAVAGAMDTLAIIDDLDLENYVPAGGVEYPNNSMGDRMSLIAQLIREGLGLRAVTASMGGWDTHNGQGDDGGGYFFGHIEDLSEAVEAFWQDLSAAGLANDVVVVIHSEFGRRARQNGQGGSGTDHGSGNVMMVLGGRILGGQFYGTFAGLANNQLYGGEDVSPEVDFRRVLGTIVQDVLGNPNVDQVFPGYTGFTPMPFVDFNAGTDVIFKNGFGSN